MKEYSAQKVYENIVKYAELENKKVLEIGCGTGRISALLSQRTHFLVAIDPDENAIRKAKTNTSGVDFCVGSGEKLNFADRFFDVVIFTLSLHHQNSRKALLEAARVVKTAGNILVIEPVVDGEVERVFAFLHNENEDKRLAQKAIMDSGLSIVASEVFTAKWMFANEDDLFRSMFEYYEMPFDSDIALNISTCLGEKIKMNPIVLDDTMIIQSLKKKGGALNDRRLRDRSG
jgi:SAM-dependent methyltransferase